MQQGQHIYVTNCPAPLPWRWYRQ